MKITTKRTRTGATISIRARSAEDKDALTEAVMSGDLMKALNPAVTCELCGRFDAVMEDPTWTVKHTPAPFKVCEVCAKEHIERAMYAN